MLKQFNFNSVLILLCTALLVILQQCQTRELATEVAFSRANTMSELSRFQEDYLENSYKLDAQLLTQDQLMLAVKSELSALNARVIANGQKLKNLSSSASFITEPVKDNEIISPLDTLYETETWEDGKRTSTSTTEVLNSPTYEIPEDELYKDYLRLPIGSRWNFEDNFLSGSTTLLASGNASTKYNLKSMQFDVDIFRKKRLFGPDKFTANITSDKLPINNAKVTVRKIPRPILTLNAGVGYGITWDGSTVVTGPTISAQLGIPIFTILSK